MANKYKNIRQADKKQQADSQTMRTVMLIALAAVISIAAFVAFGSGPKTAPNGTASQQQTGPSVADLQKGLPDLEKNAQANPTSFEAQKRLADAQYDLGFAYLDNNQVAEMVPDFAKAVETYQKALAIKFDIGAQTDMATAAFYANKPDIADAAFKTAIEKQPEFYTARLNYGIFLREAKQDNAAAKVQFEYVANQKKDPNIAKSAADLLKTVQ